MAFPCWHLLIAQRLLIKKSPSKHRNRDYVLLGGLIIMGKASCWSTVFRVLLYLEWQGEKTLHCRCHSHAPGCPSLLSEMTKKSHLYWGGILPVSMITQHDPRVTAQLMKPGGKQMMSFFSLSQFSGLLRKAGGFFAATNEMKLQLGPWNLSGRGWGCVSVRIQV